LTARGRSTYPDPVPASVVLQQDPAKLVIDADLERIALQKRVQGFFAGLEAEMGKPHFGGHARDTYRGILLRAQESGLYKPHTEDA